jgi:hypothetical protein
MSRSPKPEPLTPTDCDVSDLPFPDTLLIELAADLGMEPHEARNMARSVGWIEVPGGWKAHKQ